MSSLKDSVQVRAFGHLDPKEEFKIDGAKAFVDCVSDMRIDALRNVFFFVGASIEPTTEYETVPASNTASGGDDDDEESRTITSDEVENYMDEKELLNPGAGDDDDEGNSSQTDEGKSDPKDAVPDTSLD